MLVRETHWYWPQTKISKFLWYLYYNLLEHVNGIICPGEASYRYWKSYGFSNVYIVHYYALESIMLECPVSRMKSIKKRLGICDNSIIILYLGRLIKKKGVDIIISAFARLIRKKPETKAVLVIAGGGSEKKKLVELCKVLGIDNRVRFLGYVSESDKECVYRLADVFVYVPRVDVLPEEWPIAPLEAMSLGIPTIVSTSVGSIPELKGGVIIVGEGNIRQLEQALEKLVSNDELRKALSKKCLKIHENLVRRSVFKEFVAALYKSLRR